MTIPAFNLRKEAEIVGFAAATCWEGEVFRSVRREICFKAYHVGNAIGFKLDQEFVADYGIFFDPNEEYLVGVLTDNMPEIPWSTFRFHRKLDQSGIDVYGPDHKRVVARIVVRRYEGKKITDLSPGSLGPTVITMAEGRAKLALLAEQQRFESGGVLPGAERILSGEGKMTSGEMQTPSGEILETGESL